MSASHIPNLLNLRDPKTSGRIRGGGRWGAGHGTAEEPEAANLRKDKIVQQTDHDASVSRISAVELGYLSDPFAKEFAPSEGAQRRMPIINRGTYVRTRAIDRLVDGFISSFPGIQKQIVSLGAGSDTRFFRLMDRVEKPTLIYHELDFPANTKQKISVIRQSKAMASCLGEATAIKWTEEELHSPYYHVHAVDLRTLDPTHEHTVNPDRFPDIDPDLPTLLVSECCLVYLVQSSADAVVSFFISNLLSPSAPVGLVIYEPINPFDSFGRVMVTNLAARGIVLQTLHRYGSLEAQKVRLCRYGFIDGAESIDLERIGERWVDEQEKARISSVEMLDEVEELNLLMKHYCIAWGWRNGNGEDEAWTDWIRFSVDSQN